MMRIFISDCRCLGDDISHQWRHQIALADFNLRRAALFTCIFCVAQMTFTQELAPRNISAKKAAENTIDRGYDQRISFR